MQKRLINEGFRVNIDLRNEKIGYKIRGHTMQRIPYLLVVGDREVEAQTVAVRTLHGEDKGSLPVDALVAMLTEANKITSANNGQLNLEE